MTITIPPEALEAAAEDVATVMGHVWTALSDDDREVARAIARAAILAALTAWPDAGMSQFHEHALILPLTENTDAEA